MEMWYAFPMQVVLVILSLGLLGLIIFFTFSPKSSKLLRLTAIIALVLIGLCIGICSILLILGPGKGTGDIPLPVFQDASPKPVKSGGVSGVFVFLLLLLAALVVIIVVALRNERLNKNKPEEKLEESPPPDLGDDVFKSGFAHQKDNDDDESFNIDI